MPPMLQLGPFVPDRASVGAPGLLQADNVLPTQDGYQTFSDLLVTELAGIDDEVRGAGRGVTQTAVPFMVGGTATKLWLSTGSAFSDVTRLAGAYTTGATDRWEIGLYGDRVLATNYADPVQGYLFPSSTEFAALSADASLARYLAIFGEFVVLGCIKGAGVNAPAIGAQQDAGLHWGAIGDPTSWPELGTAAAVAAQSDFQILAGDGGPITALVPAGEHMLVFRERQVWRMDYVGGQQIMAFRKLDDRRGCIVPGGAVAVGGLVYFPSDEGYLVCDGASVSAIGHEVIDRYWRSQINVASLVRSSVAHAPGLRSIFWAIPTSAQKPTRIFGYQYELRQWFTVLKSIDWVLTALSIGGDMDTAPLASKDMDVASPAGLGDVNMDTLSRTAEERLGAFLSADRVFYTFESDTRLPGKLVTGDFESGSQRRQFLRWLRPLYTGSGTILARVSGRNRVQDAVDFGGLAGLKTITPTGKIPARAGGRYLRAEFTLAGDVNEFQGFDAQTHESGAR